MDALPGHTPDPGEFAYSRACRAHLQDIIKIERLCFAEPWPATAFIDELSDERACYFVATSSGGDVVGFCGYWHVVDEAHIMNIAVIPSARRRGVGRGLLRVALDDAVARGMRVAFLEVREDNASAIALYGQFGFTQCGFRENYYEKENKSAVVMSAELGHGEARFE